VFTCTFRLVSCDARLTETSRYGVIDADTGRSAVQLGLEAVLVSAASGVDELDAGGTGRVVVPAETLRRRARVVTALGSHQATIYTGSHISCYVMSQYTPLNTATLKRYVRR